MFKTKAHNLIIELHNTNDRHFHNKLQTVGKYVDLSSRLNIFQILTHDTVNGQHYVLRLYVFRGCSQNNGVHETRVI